MRQLKLCTGKSISPELRKFALTLHYYSPSAYLYLRKIFSKALPHISTIRKWYTTINGLPGLTMESFRAISNKVQEMKDNGKNLYGSLIIDEMSIKQHVHWTGSRHQGYINYGPGSGTELIDNLPYAKDAFVIMVVGLNTHWKVPIAYYLINGITAEEKANIVISCLHQLHDTGIIIKTLTFDGASNNISMTSLLGANLDHTDLKPNFKDPSSETNVHIVLDPCHMIKLIRNCLGDWGILFDKNNRPIKWVYFKHLVNLQNMSGLHAGTKIRTRHIRYHKEKMKVRLAAQIFSNSVADALEYCAKDLKNKLFENAEPTIEFCRKINNIFDLLNSRNFLSKSPYNKPLSDNFINFKQFIEESIDYLQGIQCLEKSPKFGKRLVLESERKTGFLGLITCLRTIENLYTELIETKQLQFILSYKFNQDHLEMLFGAIRAKGGFNNNPTVAQFEAAYKSIIINAEVKCPSSANAMALDNTSILRISSSKKKIYNEDSELLDLLCVSGTEIIETEDILSIYQHSTFLNDVVAYISGFVVHKIKKSILCALCSDALESEETTSTLILRKNRGGLIKPSLDVIEICKIAERVIREYTKIDKSNVVNKITIESMKRINISKYFNSLSSHFLDQEPLNNHLIQLIKIILKIYITLRLHHINSSTNAIDQKIRTFYTKLIHFNHQ